MVLVEILFDWSQKFSLKNLVIKRKGFRQPPLNKWDNEIYHDRGDIEKTKDKNENENSSNDDDSNNENEIINKDVTSNLPLLPSQFPQTDSSLLPPPPPPPLPPSSRDLLLKSILKRTMFASSFMVAIQLLILIHAPISKKVFLFYMTYYFQIQL